MSTILRFSGFGVLFGIVLGCVDEFFDVQHLMFQHVCALPDGQFRNSRNREYSAKF